MPIYFNSAPTDFPFQFDSIGIRSPHYVRMVFRFIIICRLRKEAASSLLMKKNIPLEKTREYFLPLGYHMFTILLQVSGLLCLPLSVVP